MQVLIVIYRHLGKIELENKQRHFCVVFYFESLRSDLSVDHISLGLLTVFFTTRKLTGKVRITSV